MKGRVFVSRRAGELDCATLATAREPSGAFYQDCLRDGGRLFVIEFDDESMKAVMAEVNPMTKRGDRMLGVVYGNPDYESPADAGTNKGAAVGELQPLRVTRLEPAKLKPDAETVRVLGELLEMAKTGELLRFVASCSLTGGETLMVRAGEQGAFNAMLGELEYLKWWMIKRNEDQKPP